MSIEPDAPAASLDFHMLDVFTEQRLSGNPLAVVQAADDLSDERMQDIAREFNLSETVFLLKPLAGGDARLRIFTPAQELPFAGHPTIGTACLLAQLGRVVAGDVVDIVLEEKVGPVPVRIRREPGRAVHAQLTTAVLPSFAAAPSIDDLAAALALSIDDIETVADAPRSASCGVAYTLVPLKSVEALGRTLLSPPQAAGGFSGPCYVYCPDGDSGHWRARMFAMDLGVGEDPATGSAAAALCGHLADRSAQASGTLAWHIRQGVEMMRPSVIEIEADKQDGRITAVRVAGHAILFATGRLFL